MWVGLNTTMDEAGTGAYKIVELDTLFNREMTLIRDVQGQESDLFLTYFPHIHILNGGVESGFRRISVDKYKPRLFIVRGNKTPRVSELELSFNSLNNGDSFILDNGLNVYVWKGSKSSSFEKFKAESVAKSLKDDRSGVKITSMNEGDNNDDFFNLLGGKGNLKVKDESKEVVHEKVLLRVSDTNGPLQINEVGRGPNVKRSLLDTNDVFILDLGYEVYLWIGKGSSNVEKQRSLGVCHEYVKKQNKDIRIPILAVKEGRETDGFEKSF